MRTAVGMRELAARLPFDVAVGVHYGRFLVTPVAADGPAVRIGRALTEARVLAATGPVGEVKISASARKAFASLDLEIEEREEGAALLRDFAHYDRISLVQRSAVEVLGEGSDFADQFHYSLFETAPDAERHLSSSREVQGEMLSFMLRNVVYGLSRPEQLALGLQGLGQREAEGGVTSDDYAMVGRVFVETIESRLGDGVGKEVLRAWRETIGQMLESMHFAG